MRALLNDLASHNGRGNVVILALLIAGSSTVVMACTYVVQYETAAITQTVGIVTQDALFARVARFHGLRPFEDPAFHDRVMLAQQGAQQAPQAIVPLMQGVASSLIVISSFTGVLIRVWPPIAVLVVAAAIPMLALRVRQTKHAMRVITQVAPTQRRAFFFRFLLTDLRAAKEMRLFGFGPLMHRRMLSALKDASDEMLALQRRQAVGQVLLACVAGGVTTAALVVAARGAQEGKFSIGDVSLFVAAVANIQGALNSVVSQFAQAQRNLGLLQSYVDVVDARDDLDDGATIPGRLTEAIVFHDVWFRYEHGSAWTLSGVTLTIRAGQTTGIVGLNGAGKSTLLKLLCRFYDPDRGYITWDGVDLRAMDIVLLRKRISAVFQDFGTYDLTASENIALGAVERLNDQEAIRHAAQLVDIDDALEGLPAGYETMLTRIFASAEAVSGMLSIGQWQRLAIARALFRSDADLVILDEPNASLDALGEGHVHAGLRAMRPGTTRIVVSHRLSSLRFADMITVLGDGRVLEHGTHETLLVANGQYAKLFAAQADAYRQETNHRQDDAATPKGASSTLVSAVDACTSHAPG
jgi:ATP-binding cassette, subfamily B, bacterial